MKVHNEGKILVSHQDYERLSALLAMDAYADIDELLEEELNRAEIVQKEEMPADVVTMNSTVRFKDVVTHKESEVTLVYPHEADVEKMKISVLAPIGAALLGLKVGQLIDWHLPNGKTKRLQVLSIVFQPEAAENGGSETSNN